MLPLIILLLSIFQNLSASLIQNSTGSLDEYGTCHCSIIQPDFTFPADEMERLQKAAGNLTRIVNEEITKIHNYESTMTVYMGQLKDLTTRVEVMETGRLSYSELDFELIKLEIKEMEHIILELRTSLNGSNLIVETLYQEIRNISITISRMEVYDKNNVLVIRREMSDLQRRLEECQQNNSKPNLPSRPSPLYGTCDHGNIVNISKPTIVQQNINGANYYVGGWGKDSSLGADQNIFWVAPLNTDRRTMTYVYTYPSYSDLMLYKHTAKTFSGSNGGQGGGMIMYSNSMYYNCYNTNNLCKFNMTSNVVKQLPLKNAPLGNSFSYASTPWQDIDLAADEEGLWVIYASVQEGGNMLISKLDADTLEVKQTWSTSVYKPGVTNAFMVCGVLYATRIYRTMMEEIFYMYDTKTGKEEHLSIPIEKVKTTIHSMSYNPNDHKLYMYIDGFLFTYDLTFSPKKNSTL